MAPESFTVDAILFDMDGTLVDSTPAADVTYSKFCAAHGITATGHLHGVRMQDSIRQWLPQSTPDEIQAMAKKFESDLLLNAQELVAAGKTGLIVLPGVQRLLGQIFENPKAEEHYAICTSAGRQFASTALSTTAISVPQHLVTADDCTHGKPNPEPYLRGAEALNKKASNCLVIEDAPAGISAGLASGATTIAVCTSHTREQLKDCGAHYTVDTLESVNVEWTDDQSKMKITVRR